MPLLHSMWLAAAAAVVGVAQSSLFNDRLSFEVLIWFGVETLAALAASVAS